MMANETRKYSPIFEGIGIPNNTDRSLTNLLSRKKTGGDSSPPVIQTTLITFTAPITVLLLSHRMQNVVAKNRNKRSIDDSVECVITKFE